VPAGVAGTREDPVVELLTIGAFARAARLTPKALRLYDGLGLLVPAAVDAESGYRRYDPAQLARAELIARLRRVGMPLAEIAEVCALEPPAAAEAIAGYWRRVTADTAERARLAASLVSHLSQEETTMTFHFARRHETGSVRTTNEDYAYADDKLLAVADGGGGPIGARASAAAVEALTRLDPSADPLVALTGAVTEIDKTIRGLADGQASETQPITTLTALVRRGNRLALVHIGDTRAYLLRGGELVQLTQDHTWVQSQVDAGKLTAAEASAHPDRPLLTRALGFGDVVEADLALRTAVPGDRYLLCSDGVSAVLDRATLFAALSGGGSPQETVDRLTGLCFEQGAPDNIAVVVADAS
jgi:PPM family protein phosphatase